MSGEDGASIKIDSSVSCNPAFGTWRRDIDEQKTWAPGHIPTSRLLRGLQHQAGCKCNHSRRLDGHLSERVFGATEQQMVFPLLKECPRSSRRLRSCGLHDA